MSADDLRAPSSSSAEALIAVRSACESLGRAILEQPPDRRDELLATIRRASADLRAASRLRATIPVRVQSPDDPATDERNTPDA